MASSSIPRLHIPYYLLLTTHSVRILLCPYCIRLTTRATWKKSLPNACGVQVLKKLVERIVLIV